MAIRLDQEYLPPLLRGLGFSLVLSTSIVVGMAEHREQADRQERAQDVRARVEAERSKTLADRQLDPLAREVRLMRLQIEDDDLADSVFENPWFQLLGSLGTGLIAASFFLEALTKWVRRVKAKGNAASLGPDA